MNMNKYLNESGFMEITDINLATCAYYFGFKIDSIDKTNPSRAVFIIERDANLDSLIEGFWSKTLLVDPLTYFNCLKEIKTRLYQS